MAELNNENIPVTNSIVTLFNTNKTKRAFPATKVEAISDKDDVTLATLLNQRVSKDDVAGINQALSTGSLILTENKHYGATLPTPGQKGRIFFRLNSIIPSAEEASF